MTTWLTAAVLLVAVVGIYQAVAYRERKMRRRTLQALAPLLAVHARMEIRRTHELWRRQAEAAVTLGGKPGSCAAALARLSVQLPAQRGPSRAGTPDPASNGERLDRPSARDHSRPGAEADGLLAAGTIAAVGAHDVADWWQSDAGLLDAVGRITKEDIDNAADLWAEIGPDGRDWDLGDNLLRSLRGYVGEYEAADLLTRAGLTVEWPEAANQAGYDLIAGGAAVNVKVRADADSLQEHFSRYPDIPVVVNEDMVGLPEGAIRFNPGTGLDPDLLIGENVVVVAEGLLLADVQETVTAGLVDNADPLDDTFEVLAPGLGALIVGVRSAAREGRLASRGDTEWTRAAKNIAVDVGTRGGGTLAGAAASGLAVDATFGGFLLGIPTIVATAAGALGGARGGAAAGARIKNAPLRKAQQEAQTALSEYGTAVQAQHDAAEKQVRWAEQRQSQKLAKDTAGAARAHRADLGRTRAQLVEAAKFDAHAAAHACTAELARLCAELESEVIAANGAPKQVQLRAVEHALRQWRRSTSALVASAGNGDPSDAEFWDAMCAAPVGRRLMQEHLQRRMKSRRAAHRALVGRAVVRAYAAQRRREQAQTEVHRVAGRAVAAGQRGLEPQAEQLRRCHDKHLRELRAAGAAVPEREPDAGASS